MAKSTKTIILRGVADLSFLIAAIVMFINYQKVDKKHIKFSPSYKDWSGFMFCVVVNCIVCIYNFAVLLIPGGSMLWKTVIVSDVIVNILVAATLGAGWQTYAVINQGNLYVHWPPICCIAHSFCNKVLGSLIASTLGFVISFGLLMGTLHVCVDPFLVGAN